MIPAHVIARIRERVHLPDVARRYLFLRKAGVRFIAVCPFHKEKTASFTVYPKHYYCFGCGIHGGVVDFVMRMEQIPFLDAIQHLSAQYGIPLEDRPVTRLQQQQARAEADTCKWWWEQKLTYLQERISTAVAEQDDDFAQSLGNILIHMKGITPAERYSVFARQITHKERAEYAEHVRCEQFFAQSWMGLAHMKWAH